MAVAPDRFGPFTFDRQRMVVMKDGEAISLGGRGAALLAALLDARGETVDKDTLIGAAWPDVIVEDANLTVQIGALRKLLGPKPDGSDWIVTVRHLGYRLIAGGATPASDGAAASRPAIAVLPFANLGSDPEQEFVADGVVEDLITALSRFRTFAVVSRSSSFVYKGRAVDAREAARELGVRYLLEGSVRRSGQRMRVTAQLIEGATGNHLWAEKFDGAATDMFDFQDAITETVIGLIEPHLRRAEIERARQKRPETLDAWDLYVQASPLVHSGDVANWNRALELLGRAMALDSSYAPPIALAAWAHDKRHFSGGPGLPNYETDRPAAMALIERAVALDPDDAFARALHGWFHIRHQRDFSRGIEIIESAVALNPNNSLILDLATAAHLYGGDLDRLIVLGNRALQLSPGSPIRYAIMATMAAARNAVGRYEEALDLSLRVVELEPNYMYGHVHVAVACAQLGRIEEARSAVAEVLRIRPQANMAVTMADRIRPPERTAIWAEGLRKAGLPEIPQD